MTENELQQLYNELKQKITNDYSLMTYIIPAIRKVKIKELIDFVEKEREFYFAETDFDVRVKWVQNQLKDVIGNGTYPEFGFNLGETDYALHKFVNVKPTVYARIQYYEYNRNKNDKHVIPNLFDAGMCQLGSIESIKYNDKFIVIDRHDYEHECENIVYIFRTELSEEYCQDHTEFYVKISPYFEDYSENSVNLLWDSGYFADENNFILIDRRDYEHEKQI